MPFFHLPFPISISSFLVLPVPCVHADTEYWSREYILQSDWFKLFLPRSRAVYMTHMHGFYQTLSPRLQWVGSGTRDHPNCAAMRHRRSVGWSEDARLSYLWGTLLRAHNTRVSNSISCPSTLLLLLSTKQSNTTQYRR